MICKELFFIYHFITKNLYYVRQYHITKVEHIFDFMISKLSRYPIAIEITANAKADKLKQ